jgi:hypothetical protein
MHVQLAALCAAMRACVRAWRRHALRVPLSYLRPPVPGRDRTSLRSWRPDSKMQFCAAEHELDEVRESWRLTQAQGKLQAWAHNNALGGDYTTFTQ